MDVKGRWLEVKIKVPPELQDALSAFLFDLGCLGTSQLEGADLLVAYFPLEAKEGLLHSIEGCLNALANQFPAFRASRPALREVADENWGLKWREHFKPQKITESLMIIPPWESRPDFWNGEVIVIDPGPAFGTGQHPTTRMCLACMEECLEQVRGEVLDVGTGSGILAIYAARLGASKVVGIDIDPEAARWAGRNLEINGVERKVFLVASGIEAVRAKFHLVMANLTRDEILKIKSSLVAALRPGGRLILSGLLASQMSHALAAFKEKGLSLVEQVSSNEWGALILERSADKAG